MLQKICLVCLICCAIRPVCYTNTNTTLFNEANAAYQQAQYPKAISIYKQLLSAGFQSADLQYNLGNAYYKSDSLAKAVLHYERALQLAPKKVYIKKNLAFVQSELTDQLEVLPPFFLTKWWSNLRSSFSSNAWSILGILLIWLGTVGFLRYQLGNTRKMRKQGFIGGIALVSVGALCLALAFSKARLENDSQQAIIMKDVSALKIASEASSPTVLEVHAGLKVKLLDQINDWIKVQLSNGEEGWIQQSDLEQI